jgi:hypothetical protein
MQNNSFAKMEGITMQKQRILLSTSSTDSVKRERCMHGKIT